MGMNNFLTGTGVALVTPFREDTGVDYDGLRRLVRHVTAGGVDYLVVLGTTAETATLTSDEKTRILEVVAEENAGRLPLVAGIGGNNTLAVAEELQGRRLDGYRAILSVSPYYNRPTQEGIYRHFCYLAERTPLPIIVYNVPARTGSNMMPETVARLAADCPNIIGVKEASGNLEQIRRLIGLVPRGFLVISGDDSLAVPTILEGGVGIISVLGQAIPGRFTAQIRAALAGRQGEAGQMAVHLEPLVELLFREGNPAGVKALLARDGICGSQLRLPLVRASAQLCHDLGAFMEQLAPEKA